MRFTEKYPDAPADAEYEKRLYNCGRYFACDTGMGGCGEVTPWRDISYGGAEFPVCSEECVKAMDAQLERTLDEINSRTIPSSSQVVNVDLPGAGECTLSEVEVVKPAPEDG